MAWFRHRRPFQAARSGRAEHGGNGWRHGSRRDWRILAPNILDAKFGLLLTRWTGLATPLHRAAFTRTNTDLRALGETTKYADPVAGRLGISLGAGRSDGGALANMGASEGVMPGRQRVPVRLVWHHRQRQQQRR